MGETNGSRKKIEKGCKIRIPVVTVLLLIILGFTMLLVPSLGESATPASSAASNSITKITLSSSTCSSYLDGSWDIPSSTCGMRHYFTISSTVLLFIPAGITLHTVYSFTNNGTIANNGTIVNDGGLNNHGTINSNGGLGNSDTLTNYGVISSAGGFDNTYNLDNKPTGTIMINKGGTFTNYNGAKFTNEYDGIITNKAGGTIDNQAPSQILNSGTLDNYGTIINELLSSSSYALLDNFWVITNEIGGLIDNLGSFPNTGTVTNYGKIDNTGSSSFIQNFVAIYNFGTIDSFGAISNQGTLIDECKGQLINEVGSSYQGNPPTQASCSIATASVYVRFKPNTFTVTPPATLTVSGKVTNNGSSTFYVTSCKLSYKLSTSNTWTGLKCKMSSFTVFANSSAIISQTLSFPSGFAPGTYDYMIVYYGTVSGVASKSHAGKLTVTVT